MGPASAFTYVRMILVMGTNRITAMTLAFMLGVGNPAMLLPREAER